LADPPRLSVNVNKVATLRNSRGGEHPRVLRAVEACLDAGAHGITVHPRADRRHITPDDVRSIATAMGGVRPAIELNIEGDPRPEWLDLVRQVRPEQCTLVPVVPGEITSQAGWRRAEASELPRIIADLRGRGIRVSAFVDAEPAAVRWAAEVGADRVELYTEPFARAFERGRAEARASFERFALAARTAHEVGLGVNAGHDLDVDNLAVFRDLPFLDEVSIGHAIVSRAVFSGLAPVIRQFLTALGHA
jgi:pyridoxine 5-phosphate synthase